MRSILVPIRVLLIGVVSISILPATLFAGPPVNDIRDEAFRVFDVGYIVGDNTDATAESGELTHGGVGAGKSLWWRWANASEAEPSILTLQALQPGSDFVLVLYREDAESALVEETRVIAEDGGPVSVSASLENSSNYLIVVDSLGDSPAGRFYFSLDQAPVIDAPVQVRVKRGQAFDIPLNISGFPDSVSLQTGMDGFYYDSLRKVIVGSLPYYDPNGEDYIEVIAQNAFGESRAEIQVLLDQSQPVLTSPASALAFVGEPFEYVLEFDGDPDSQPQEVLFDNIPDGFAPLFENGNWRVRGVPQFDGTSTFGVRARHPDFPGVPGGEMEAEVSVEVLDATYLDLPPAIISPVSARAYVGVPFSYQIETLYPAHLFNSSTLPDGLALDQKTGLISGTPTGTNSSEVLIMAAGSGGPSVGGVLHINFDSPEEVAIDIPPVIVAYEGVPFVYPLEYPEVESFHVSGLPPGLDYDVNTRTIAGTPLHNGQSSVSIDAYYFGTQEARFEVTLVVVDPENQIHLTSPAQVRGKVGELLQYDLAFSPVAQDFVDVRSLPSGLSFLPEQNRIVGVPQFTGMDQSTIDIGQNEFQIQFLIDAPNSPPVFQNAAQTIGRVGEFFYFPLNADGAVSYRIVSGTLPPGLILGSNTGLFLGTPSQSGNVDLIIEATNAYGEHAISQLSLLILSELDPIQSVILSPGQMYGFTGEPLVYSIGSTNPAGGSYNVSGLPQGFYLDSGTGLIFGSSDLPLDIQITVQHNAAAALVSLVVEAPEESDYSHIVTSAPSYLGTANDWVDFYIQLSEAFVPGELDFRKDSYWPDSLQLDPLNGRVYGTLSQDWPPDFGFSVWNQNGDFITESSLTIIDSGRGRPHLLDSPAYIRVFAGDYVEYTFETFDDRAEVSLFGYPNELTYDEVGQRLYGYVAESRDFEVDFRLQDEGGQKPSVNGRVVIDVRDSHERPAARLMSPMAPLAVPDGVFEMPVYFDQPDYTWRLENAPEWLVRTGPDSVGGLVPESAQGVENIQISGEGFYGPRRSWRIILRYESQNDLPPLLTSPASAQGYVGVPFEYQLAFDRTPDSYQIDGLPDWLQEDGSTGRLYGTPDIADSWILNVDMTPANGPSSFAKVVLQVQQEVPAPLFLARTPPPAFVGLPFVYQFRIEGLVDHYNSSLPDEVAVDWNAGQIAGTLWQGGWGWFYLDAGNPYSHSSINVRYDIFESAPFVWEDPLDLTTPLGAHALFAPRYAGVDVSHAWYKDTTVLVSTQYPLELLSTELSDQGSYQLILQNSIGEAATASALLNVGSPERMRDWMISQLGDQVLGSDVTGPEDSYVLKGSANLLKWGFGLGILDEFSSDPMQGQQRESGFEVNFPRAIAAEDVIYTVECATTLEGTWDMIARRPAGGTWQALLPGVSVEESGDGPVRMVRVTDTNALPAQFFRVNLELTEESEQSMDFGELLDPGGLP